MNKGLLILLAVLGVIAAAGTIFVLSIDPETDETPVRDATHPTQKVVDWVCLAQEETHDFDLTVGEIAQYPDGVTCPDCSSYDVMRALPCPECGRHYPIARYNASPTSCMHCSADLPGADIDVFHGHEGH